MNVLPDSPEAHSGSVVRVLGYSRVHLFHRQLSRSPRRLTAGAAEEQRGKVLAVNKLFACPKTRVFDTPTSGPVSITEVFDTAEVVGPTYKIRSPAGCLLLPGKAGFPLQRPGIGLFVPRCRHRCGRPAWLLLVGGNEAQMPASGDSGGTELKNSGLRLGPTPCSKS